MRLFSIRTMLLVTVTLFFFLGWQFSFVASHVEQQKQEQQQQLKQQHMHQHQMQQQQSSIPIKPQQQTTQPQQLVVQLTSKSFDRSVRNGNVWLIEFYAPWCAHCQQFAGTYEQVAYHLQHAKTRDTSSSTGTNSYSNGHKRKSIQVAKVNTASERALGTRFSINSLPSFYVIDGWSVYEFRGYRSLDALVEFAKGGYLQTEPLPFLMSPMGPMGQLQGVLVTVGYVAMDVFYMLQRVTGLSATLLSIVACVLGISCTFFSLIIFALFLTPKSKVD